MPSFTFTATAEVALVAGAVPVFVDVDPDTFNIDADDLVKRIQEVKKEGRLRPRAIVAVDLYGLPADYDTLQKIADEEGLFLLADAAQGFGGTYKGKRVGAVAPATATSFFPAKPLGCYGDGGAVLTNDDGIVEKVRSIRLHGKGSGKYDIVRVGLNARMDTLQASILLPKLAVFAEEIERREAISRMYDERLVAVATVPARVDWATSAWAQYTLKVAERERVAAELREKGVPTMVYYPRPMHLQPGYQGFGSGEGSLPVSERLSGEVLSLPMHPYLEEAMVDRICTAVTEVMGG
jgi:UDP-2-acetamido-2-deoxy-ribo-hexuluronate aminotransferase